MSDYDRYPNFYAEERARLEAEEKAALAKHQRMMETWPEYRAKFEAHEHEWVRRPSGDTHAVEYYICGVVGCSEPGYAVKI